MLWPQTQPAVTRKKNISSSYSLFCLIHLQIVDFQCFKLDRPRGFCGLSQALRPLQFATLGDFTF